MPKRTEVRIKKMGIQKEEVKMSILKDPKMKKACRVKENVRKQKKPKIFLK